MKTLSILAFAGLIFVISLSSGTYKTSLNQSVPQSEFQFQKRIVVRTQDVKGNKVTRALVRVTGPSYDFCCYTDTLLGECNFLVDNEGIYQICGSKNNLYKDTSISVNNCQLYYLVELKLTKPGACINCDQERIIK